MPKLSGACGKLMCCLRYEEEVYKENLEKLPKVGQMVKAEGEEKLGKVVSVDILGLKARVRFDDSEDDQRFETFPVDMLKWERKDNKK